MRERQLYTAFSLIPDARYRISCFLNSPFRVKFRIILLCVFFPVSVGMMICYKVQENIVLKQCLEPCQH